MILKSGKEGNMIPLLLPIAAIASVVGSNAVRKKVEKKSIEQDKEDIKKCDEWIKNVDENIKEVMQVKDNLEREKEKLIEDCKNDLDTDKQKSILSLEEKIKECEALIKEGEERNMKNEIVKKRLETEVSRYYAQQEKKTT